MNIVFVTDNYVDPTSGGIARTTHILGKALSSLYSYRCYSVYANSHTDSSSLPDGFSGVHGWKDAYNFKRWITSLDSSILIIQGPCVLTREILAMELEHVHKIYAFHGTPGFEIIPLRHEIIWHRIVNRIEPKWLMKQCVLQLGANITSIERMKQLLTKKYSIPYGKAEKIVVLSDGIINQYQQIAPGEREKFVSIPNALSFPNEEMVAKSKEVLVVARLDDWHKRILDILKIWRIVQTDSCALDWTLRIVGDGIDRAFYQSYVTKKKIANVVFEGQQNPIRYYQNASIFMMTSACEGLPMTILEAQQFGCIPILYNSFASATDIVEDGKNGILVPANNQTEFAKKLKDLMQDNERCAIMSKECITSCQRFSIEKVAAKWNDLFQEIAIHANHLHP